MDNKQTFRSLQHIVSMSLWLIVGGAFITIAIRKYDDPKMGWLALIFGVVGLIILSFTTYRDIITFDTSTREIVSCSCLVCFPFLKKTIIMNDSSILTLHYEVSSTGGGPSAKGLVLTATGLVKNSAGEMEQGQADLFVEYDDKKELLLREFSKVLATELKLDVTDDNSVEYTSGWYRS
ncbi:MAG: hypothetical protein HRT89_21100 [Lentisphaeria bacterium]|nr:hypothetical protein [Lentisphaeria bacterium]